MAEKEYIKREKRYIEVSKLPNFEAQYGDGKQCVLLPFEHLYDIPAADVVEVRHGKWGDTGDFQLDTTYSGWKCSECGFIYCGGKFNYCPNCGAKMDGKGEGE